MKKLLVTLLLGAGLVSVTSADEPLDCTNNTTYQCCADVYQIHNIIPYLTEHAITTTDKYLVSAVDTVLINDGEKAGSWCLDGATYLDANGKPTFHGNFTWQPGAWMTTIKSDF